MNKVALKIHTYTQERNWGSLEDILWKTTSVEMIDNYIGFHLYRQNIRHPAHWGKNPASGLDVSFMT
jgi:hypothetical protein